MKTNVQAVLAVTFIFGWLSTSCGKQNAANDLSSAMKAFNKAQSEFGQTFATVEPKLQAARAEAPQGVPALIQNEMLPALDRLLAAYEKVVGAGATYVKSADGKDPNVVGIAGNMAGMRGAHEAWKGVRSTYEKEAALFAKGAPDAEAVQALAQERLAHMRAGQQATR